MQKLLPGLWLLIVAVIFNTGCSGSRVQENIGQVQLGIDVLVANHYDLLHGKKVALVTNHTGRNRDGYSDIDLFFDSPEVQLVKLFSPEHGLRGKLDGNISNEVDEKTGLPIYSLFGKNKKPSSDALADIDVIVFDIQDIGTRFYTYIGTMVHIMQAAQENDKEIIVLDRPNPINGITVNGTIPPSEVTGNRLTSIYPIPTRHGMTVGELARMFNDEFGIGCQLTVVPMKNWSREMFWDETGIVWVNPSPNMKTLTGAILYPGLGLLETTNLSMGRGTDIPFEIFGAPWLDGETLAKKMNALNLLGIRFVPWSFIPDRKPFKYQGEICRGVKAVLYNRNIYDGYLTGLYMAGIIHDMYPDDYEFLSGFKVSMGCPETEEWLKNGIDPNEIKQRKAAAMAEFMETRSKYLLY